MVNEPAVNGASRAAVHGLVRYDAGEMRTSGSKQSMTFAQRVVGAATLSAVVGVLLSAGCGGSSAGTAKDTLRSYASALAKDDARAAYLLLSPSLRLSLSAEEFEKQWREHRVERAEQRQQLMALLSSQRSELIETAELRLVHGSMVKLTAEAQPLQRAWQLSDANLRAVVAPTPQDVLKLLLFAVEQRNYQALLRLLSTSERLALEAQLTERLERLRAALVKPTIEIKGDRARIEYDPRFFIELVREGNSWRIADLN